MKDGTLEKKKVEAVGVAKDGKEIKDPIFREKAYFQLMEGI